MPPFVKAILFLLVISLLAGIWQIVSLFFGYRPITNFPPDGRVVIAFGDSLTEGVGASSPDRGYVAVLGNRLSVPIANFGKSGDTTAAALARVPDALLTEPDIVIVLLGGNDRLANIPNTETFANLERIIRAFQEKGAVVLLVGIQGGLIGDRYAEDFESLAESTGSAFVPDILRGIISDPSLMSDAVHPNDRGYERMTDRIAPALMEILPAGTHSPGGTDTTIVVPRSE